MTVTRDVVCATVCDLNVMAATLVNVESAGLWRVGRGICGKEVFVEGRRMLWVH